MSKKELPEEMVFDRLGESLAWDLLTDAYSDEEVSTLIREAGGDPDAIGRRGADLAHRLLKRKRLSWMDEADRKQHRLRAILDDPIPEADGMSHQALQLALFEMRSDPRAGRAIRATFSKRSAEVSSTEELRALYREAKRLQRMEDAVNNEGAE